MARDALNKRGVPFKEVQVWEEESNAELKRVTGSTEVPALVVGRSVHKGFQQDAFDALLDSARYPRAGILPARNQGAPKPPEEYVPPGQRQQVKVVNPDLYKGRPVPHLVEHKPKKSGRNMHGEITMRHQGGGHKQLYRKVDFKRDKDRIVAKVERLEYDPNRSAFLALLCYADGERRYIIAPKGVSAGAQVVSGAEAPIKTAEPVKPDDVKPEDKPAAKPVEDKPAAKTEDRAKSDDRSAAKPDDKPAAKTDDKPTKTDDNKPAN